MVRVSAHCVVTQNSKPRETLTSVMKSTIFKCTVLIRPKDVSGFSGDLGEVKVHLNLTLIARYQSNGCLFVDIQCAYCSAEFARCEMPEHLSQCPKRPFSCECCQNYDSYYDDICHYHWTVCVSYPMVYPNRCSKVIPRHSIEEHIENNFPLTITECEFKPYGCKERLPHIEMQTHMKCIVAAHESLKMMMSVVKMLKTQEKEVREVDREVLEKYRSMKKSKQPSNEEYQV